MPEGKLADREAEKRDALFRAWARAVGLTADEIAVVSGAAVDESAERPTATCRLQKSCSPARRRALAAS
jgi:hypothetical protein